MKKNIFLIGSILVLLNVLAMGLAAQEPAPPPPPPPAEKTLSEDQAQADPCPKIALKAPNQPVREGAPVRLTATLTGGDKKVAPIFDWSLSAGVIRSGQGTASIEVDTSGAGAERSIVATLLIGGFSGECMLSESAAVSVAGPARIVDEFGALSEEEMAARIGSFAASAPAGDQAYILAYAGRNNVRGYASSTLRQIRTVAIKAGIPGDRLVTVDGGYREQAAFEFWLVPIGAEAPAPTPSLNARDIVFPKAAASAQKTRKP
jgi:hypothetical protein